MLLKGKTAVVTGCNRGIGKSVIDVFAHNGANIWACTRRRDDSFSEYLLALSNKTGVEIKPVYFDFSEKEQIKAGVKTILSEKKAIDVIVNNAGVIFTSLFQMTSIDKMKEIFDINYFSQIYFSQLLVRSMVKQGSGSIVNISSSASIEGNEGRIAYSSSKAAINVSTKVMAKELASNNIKVNGIAPGLTETEMMRTSTPEDALNNTLNRISMKRVGNPEEIANVVLFLSSDLSSYMTGQILRVDGGM